MDFEIGDTSMPSSCLGDDISTGYPTMKDGYYATMYPNTPKVREGGDTFMEKFDKDWFAGVRMQNLYYPFANRDD